MVALFKDFTIKVTSGLYLHLLVKRQLFMSDRIGLDARVCNSHFIVLTMNISVSP